MKNMNFRLYNQKQNWINYMYLHIVPSIFYEIFYKAKTGPNQLLYPRASDTSSTLDIINLRQGYFLLS